MARHFGALVALESGLSGMKPGAHELMYVGVPAGTPCVFVVEMTGAQVKRRPTGPKQPRVGALGLALPQAAAPSRPSTAASSASTVVRTSRSSVS